MTTAPQSLRREREQESARLRAEGRSWGEIAGVFRARYRVNARVAMRLARGWSQREVADRWNASWPDDPKTLKSVSYWEQWPAPSGHEPGLRVLDRLAALYECPAGDLIADLGDDRPPTAENRARERAGVQLELAGLAWPPLPVTAADVTEVAQALTMWGRQLNPELDRRTLLFSMSSAFAIAAAAPAFERLAEDRQRLAAVLDNPARLDAPSLDRVEAVIADCRRHGDILGPAVTLQCVMAERSALAAILRGSPPAALADRGRSAYAECTQLAGWLLFNLGDTRAAGHYYDEARAAAHDAHDTDLVTYILCTMSHLAVWSGQPRVGIDHAVAAQAWARRTGDPVALAYSADVTARACAAGIGQAAECDEALATAQAAITAREAGAHAPDRWYFYDESFRLGTEAETSLLLGRPSQASDAASRSLALIDPANLHNRVMTQALQAEAAIRLGDGPGACAVIGDIARATAGSASQRIDSQISRLRRELRPWDGTAPVRELDGQLRAYRPTAAIGSGTTNKS
ncbi:MAG: helix-turn-helix domain-containing protein [Trebonia sp.]